MSGNRIRTAIAREAAQLMYREGVRQYFDAKRIAARRVLGGEWSRRGDLPSNGEIRDQLRELVTLAEGHDRERRLFAMRAEALRLMRELVDWHPRLIGSVWSGHARRGSDIDLHLFGEVDLVARDLDVRGWLYEQEEVLIRTSTGFRAYHHLHLHDRLFPVELSVYSLAERREITRSSVDGLPIDRVSASRLRALLREEHAEAFAAFEQTGELDWQEGPEPGEFDGLLRELGGE
jgi:hypothetical protein